jgi:hypothetical protein
VFEATHGTAPKYAGQDKVNPGSVILSGVMMLRYMGWGEAGDAIEGSLQATIADKVVTYDFARMMEGAKEVKTSQFGDALIERIRKRPVMEMQYRKLGPTGLRVSLFSYGSWLTFGSQQAVEQSIECMGAAYEAGVNFFDNAEVYARGAAETVMGQAIAQFGWPRPSYLISSKYYWGIHGDGDQRPQHPQSQVPDRGRMSRSASRLDHLIDLLPPPRSETDRGSGVGDVGHRRSGKAPTGESRSGRRRHPGSLGDRQRHHLRAVGTAECNLFRRRRVGHSAGSTATSVQPLPGARSPRAAHRY